MIKNKKNKIDDCALVVLSCKEYSEVALLTINKLSNQNVHKYFDCYYSISDRFLIKLILSLYWYLIIQHGQKI